MKEVLYVWKLKQIHNKIYRKLKKIKAVAGKDDRQALTILKFYFTTQKQVFELDNNTLTMESVNRELEAIKDVEESKSLSLDINRFEESWLEKY